MTQSLGFHYREQSGWAMICGPTQSSGQRSGPSIEEINLRAQSSSLLSRKRQLLRLPFKQRASVHSRKGLCSSWVDSMRLNIAVEARVLPTSTVLRQIHGKKGLNCQVAGSMHQRAPSETTFTSLVALKWAVLRVIYQELTCRNTYPGRKISGSL